MRAGIHRINKTKGCKWDNYPVVVDVLLERVDHALGRGTGEQSNKINFARFVRVCGEKGDEKSHKQLQHILKEMTFTPQIAQDWNDSIDSMTRKFSHLPVYEKYISSAAHILVHSVREVVRLMQPLARTANETRDETDIKALSKMLVACHVFLHPAEEDAAQLQSRAAALLRALNEWKGNGLMKDDETVHLKRRQHEAQQYLTRSAQLPGKLQQDTLHNMAEDIENDCNQSINHIREGFLRERKEQMRKAMKDKNMGLFFRLLDGKDVSKEGISQSCPQVENVESRTSYRQAVDAAQATLRRAGFDREATTLMKECIGKVGDAQIYAPIDIIAQDDEPSVEQISQATGEQEVGPMLHRLIRHLHATSKHSPQLIIHPLSSCCGVCS